MSYQPDPQPIPARAVRTRRAYRIGAAEQGGVSGLHLGQCTSSDGSLRDVTVKRLSPALAGQPGLIEALLDEVNAAPALPHPQLVSVIDVVQQDNSVWAVLEGVDGVPLGRLLKLAGDQACPLPPAVLSHIVCDALEGLRELHGRLLTRRAHVIAHRAIDLNAIFVGRDGRARLLDLGLSRAADKTGVTRRDHITDALPYMAPELLNGGRPGPASDTYALCVLLWEALARQTLFKRATVEQTIQAILEHKVPALSSSLVDLGFLLPGMSPDAKRRFQSPEELAAALRQNLAPGSAAEVASWVRSLAPDGVFPELGSGPVHRAPPPSRVRTEAQQVPAFFQAQVIDDNDVPTVPPPRPASFGDDAPTAIHAVNLLRKEQSSTARSPVPTPPGPRERVKTTKSLKLTPASRTQKTDEVQARRVPDTQREGTLRRAVNRLHASQEGLIWVLLTLAGIGTGIMIGTLVKALLEAPPASQSPTILVPSHGASTQASGHLGTPALARKRTLPEAFSVDELPKAPPATPAQ